VKHGVKPPAPMFAGSDAASACEALVMSDRGSRAGAAAGPRARDKGRGRHCKAGAATSWRAVAKGRARPPTMFVAGAAVEPTASPWRERGQVQGVPS
jgi:hypothetical protein